MTKLVHVLNEITNFAFKGGAGDYVTVYNWGILVTIQK